MSAVVSLSDFLLARITEDEALARGFNQSAGWYSPRELLGQPGWVSLGPHDDADALQPQEAAHIVNWGAKRVLAECGAKRRMVNTFWDQNTDDRRLALRWLALPYADHPDYREEWRP